MYCTDTLSISISCLTSITFFYLKYLWTLFYQNQRLTVHLPPATASGVTGSASVSSLAPERAPAPAPAPAATTTSADSSESETASVGSLPLTPTSADALPTASASVTTITAAAPPRTKELRMTELLTLRTAISITLHRYTNQLHIKSAPDFVMEFAAQDAEASGASDAAPPPAIARRKRVIAGAALIDPFRWQFAGLCRRVSRSVAYAWFVPLYAVVLVLNATFDWADNEWSVVLVLMPMIAIFVIEVLQLHPVLFAAILRRFETYFVLYQLTIFTLASFESGSHTVRWVLVTIALILATLIVFLFEAQPLRMMNSHFRSVTLTLFLLNTIRLFVEDVLNRHRFNAARICVIVCADTRRVSISALFQIALFAARNLWNSIRHPTHFTVLRLPIMQFIGKPTRRPPLRSGECVAIR